MVGYFLILLSFVAATIGTLSQSTRMTKYAIIAIAALTALASTWVYYADEQEQILNKRLIASLVQATQDEKTYAEEIRIAANDVLNDRAMNVSGFIFSSTGLYVRVSNKSDGEFAGAVFVDAHGLRNIRYALVAQTGLVEELRVQLLTDLWTVEFMQNDWNRIAPTIGRLAISAIEEFVPETTQSSMSFPDANSIRIVAERNNGEPPYTVVLNGSQITSLASVEPLERGRIVSGIAIEQLVEQL